MKLFHCFSGVQVSNAIFFLYFACVLSVCIIQSLFFCIYRLSRYGGNGFTDKPWGSPIAACQFLPSGWKQVYEESSKHATTAHLLTVPYEHRKRFMKSELEAGKHHDPSFLSFSTIFRLFRSGMLFFFLYFACVLSVCMILSYFFVFIGFLDMVEMGFINRSLSVSPFWMKSSIWRIIKTCYNCSSIDSSIWTSKKVHENWIRGRKTSRP